MNSISIYIYIYQSYSALILLLLIYSYDDNPNLHKFIWNINSIIIDIHVIKLTNKNKDNKYNAISELYHYNLLLFR